KGLGLAINDEGVIASVLTLARLVRAAREPDFREALNTGGIPAASEPDFFELVTGFTDAVDGHLQGAGRRTDIGEMAQLSATEALAALLRPSTQGLYEPDSKQLQKATRDLSTAKGFGQLAREFYARFIHRFLLYHLGRELSQHVGANGRFVDP